MTELVSAIRAAGTATLPLSTLAAMPLFSKNSPGSPLMPPPSREYIAKARASPPKKLAPLALPSADISDDAAKVPRGKIEMQPALLAEFAGLIDAIGPAICQLLPGEAGLAVLDEHSDDRYRQLATHAVRRDLPPAHDENPLLEIPGLELLSKDPKSPTTLHHHPLSRLLPLLTTHIQPPLTPLSSTAHGANVRNSGLLVPVLPAQDTPQGEEWPHIICGVFVRARL